MARDNLVNFEISLAIFTPNTPTIHAISSTCYNYDYCYLGNRAGKNDIISTRKTCSSKHFWPGVRTRMMPHLLMWAEFSWLITQLQNFIVGHFNALKHQHVI